MIRHSWDSGPQRDGPYRDFDNLDDNGLFEFDGGFLPRRSGARLVAMNFVRLALRYQNHFNGEDLISHMLKPTIVEEVKAICYHWPSEDNLLALEILKRPGFMEHIEPRVESQFNRTVSHVSQSVEEWLRRYQPKASAAIFDNGFNMVTCLKVRIPGGHRYLVYDPQATGSGPSKYVVSTSTVHIAGFMTRTICNTPIEDAHRLDVAWFLEIQLREEVPPYARAHPNQQSSLAGPSSINNPPLFVPPETTEDIAFLAALSRALELSLQDSATNVSNSAGPSTVKRAPRYRSNLDSVQSSLPKVISAEQEQLDRITDSLIEQVCNATRLSAPNQDNAPDDVESPKSFECGVCMDSYSENRIIRIPGCRHVLCKECVQGTVKADLKSNKFPIHCPTCTAARDSAKKSTIDEELTAKGCGWCKESAFIDREVYRLEDQILCPAGCGQKWCKRCQQRIESSGLSHSCDGSSELRMLSEREGWKNCPGCNTLIEKTEGCDHMTCRTPACNTHFCYVCGEEIIRSTDGIEVNHAVRIHKERCDWREAQDQPLAGLDRVVNLPVLAAQRHDRERVRNALVAPLDIPRASPEPYGARRPHIPVRLVIPLPPVHGHPVRHIHGPQHPYRQPLGYRPPVLFLPPFDGVPRYHPHYPHTPHR
ncbi:putative E3 ubiquitin-protein ligase [Termitomyces sp. J132]|nr:putative E3 ubiquitin-protein ligase [Termitomyces sp. J132]